MHRTALLAASLLASAAIHARPAAAESQPRFFEALTFDELGVTIGVRHVQGAGYRVEVRTPEGAKHMSAAGARRMAGEIDGTKTAAAEILKQVAAGLRATADQLDLVLMDVEGRA